MQTVSAPPHRFPELEAVRGIAAVIVLVHHTLLAFAPTIHGLVDQSPSSMLGTPAFAAVNGSAAVVVFFVLSGFVLTYKAIQSRSVRMLFVQGLKRWPRLAAPILIANLIAAILVMGGLISYHSAARLTGSHWLLGSYTWKPSGLIEIPNAATEALFGTFIFGEKAYNSVLWTMYFEFFGSFFALALALFAIVIPNRSIIYSLFAVSWVGGTLVSPYFGCFVLGVAIAFLHACRFNLWIGGCATALLFGLVVVLAGYHEALSGESLPVRFYSVLAPVAKENALALRVFIHSISATLIIVMALWSGSARNVLGRSGFVFLGKISFSMYLIHTLVIASAGAFVIELLYYIGPLFASFCAILCSIFMSFILSYPLALVDAWWVRLVSRRVTSIVSPHVANGQRAIH
ncbi:acyltransferase [Mesorhizobium sp. WSM4307]|uniref:acyltransferase family protein n=1 Tax=unclassified Mesorhizobium TaxID=325217 RepID=UPI00115DEFB5|nr:MULTISPECIES: acyltransferase [unclassified Mesorhizobium]TRC79840.1 acyltransferase [Mesorhizobium sp. WSM4315]TRC88718.1 acyltransferase [Mesorhizobium sp. WSM4307]